MAGLAALWAAHPLCFKPAQHRGTAYLGWVGRRLLLARGDAQSSPIRTGPRHYLHQALLITLLNPKPMIAFCMAFVPLVIDPARRRGAPTFAAMALAIAVLTALYGLGLCAFAQVATRHVRAHQGLVRSLQRAARVFQTGFGLLLARD